MRSYKDDDGELVRAGDAISFNFGIPPKRVDMDIIERDNELVGVVTTPDIHPRECKLKLLRRYVGHFYKTMPKREYITDQMLRAGCNK